jgi:hypothetical protein
MATTNPETADGLPGSSKRRLAGSPSGRKIHAASRLESMLQVWEIGYTGT